eukprot:2193991-Amphidinium_carterae.1
MSQSQEVKTPSTHKATEATVENKGGRRNAQHPVYQTVVPGRIPCTEECMEISCPMVEFKIT